MEATEPQPVEMPEIEDSPCDESTSEYDSESMSGSTTESDSVDIDLRNWYDIVHGQQDADRALDEQLDGHETQQEYRRRLAERQQRRQKLRETLVEQMPWSDAEFMLINVHSEEPSMCNSDRDWQAQLVSNLGATVRVSVGPATFWCIGALLLRYSNYFRRRQQPLGTCTMPPQLTPLGFRAAYTWMRLQEPLEICPPAREHCQPERIVDMLYAAQHLEMCDLEMLCHRYLCSSHFKERRALQVYVRARVYGMGHLCQLMLKRVGAYYLTLVGSQEYADMPLEDVCLLLEQDNLGVNTELEILYGALRWMCIDPEERISSLPRLMECVRYTCMPRPKLLQVWFCLLAARRGMPREHIQMWFDPIIFCAATYCPGLWERVNKAMSVANLQLQFTSRTVLFALMQAFNLHVEPMREWYYDERCPFHVRNPMLPNQIEVGIKDFLNYAISLAHEDQKLMSAKDEGLTQLWEPLWDPRLDYPKDDLSMTTTSSECDSQENMDEEALNATNTSTNDADQSSNVYQTFTDSQSTPSRHTPDLSPLISGASSPTTNVRISQATTNWLQSVQAQNSHTGREEASLAVDEMPESVARNVQFDSVVRHDSPATSASCVDDMDEFLDENLCIPSHCEYWRKVNGYAPDPENIQLRALCQLHYNMGCPKLKVPFSQLYIERCHIMEETLPLPCPQGKQEMKEVEETSECTTNSLVSTLQQREKVIAEQQAAIDIQIQKQNIKGNVSTH